MRAVGYFVEGARAEGAPRTMSQQHERFLAFCRDHGYEVAATFVDTSDSDDPEGGFRQMLAFLERGDRGFTVAVVDSLGVLGSDLGRAAVKALAIEATGVSVYDAATASEATKAIVDGWAERGEGTPISERVRAAMRRKAVRGEALGRPPYGYRVGPRRRLELVPEEAVVVQYIYRLYLNEDLGIRRIAGRLNEEGIKTRRGGRWSMVTVRDILRNRAYLGTYSRFGVRIPDSHPALISADEFRRVQDRMAQRRKGGSGRSVAPFLLSGLVFCARCGNRLIGVSRRQRWTTRDGDEHHATYRYYQCESRTNQNACSYNTQRAAELEERVRSQLAEPGAGIARLHRTGDPDAYANDVQAEVGRIEGRMRRGRRQVEELVAEVAHGHLSLERMRSLGTELAREQRELVTEAEEARARLALQASEAARREHLETARRRLLADWDALNDDERQSLLREVVDRVDVDGEDVRVFLRP